MTTLVMEEKNRLSVGGSSNKTVSQRENSKDFLANLAYEMRVPFQAVVRLAKLLDKNKPDKSLQIEVDEIEHSTNHMKNLIEDVAVFSELEDDAVKIVLVELNVLDLLKKTKRQMQPLLQGKNLSFSFEFGEISQRNFLGDTWLLSRLFHTLLIHVIKFTKEGGHVSVNSSFEEDLKGAYFWTVTAKSSISTREDVHQFFEDFIPSGLIEYNSIAQRKDLGMLVCKKITNLLKGTIEIDSSLGYGVGFRVSIPLHVASKTDRGDISINSTTVSENSSQKRVLVVDDYLINRLLISNVLKKKGFVCDLAVNGYEAYDLFEKNHYDLLITDIQMPVMDGVGLTKLVRSNLLSAKANVPIIGYNGITNTQSREEFSRCGIDGFLEKPFLEADLDALLERLVGSF